MKFDYAPDTYDYNVLNEKKVSDSEFVMMQLKVKEGIEHLLNGVADFKKVDNYIFSCVSDIPLCDDEDYNFYHYNSKLGSKIVFLRNNIHVERLSLEEMEIVNQAIVNDLPLNTIFVEKIIEKVIYEDSDNIFLGTPLDKNLVNGKSIILEFAFNDLETTSLEQYKKIMKCFEISFKEIQRLIQNKYEYDVSYHLYDMFTPIVDKENSNVPIFLRFK